MYFKFKILDQVYHKIKFFKSMPINYFELLRVYFMGSQIVIGAIVIRADKVPFREHASRCHLAQKLCLELLLMKIKP